MSKKMLFVLNPLSGKGAIKNHFLDIVDIFTKNGWEVTVHPTQSASDAFFIVSKTGSRYSRIVASGGDGTLNEVIRGLMTIDEEKRPDLAYIPSGTVNDFASNMNIPKNMKKAANRAVTNEKFKCDVGEFNDKNFAYVAAFGLFTNVSYVTPQQSKNLLGQMAYFLEGIKQLHTLKSYKMRVEYEEKVIEDEFILGLVGNSNHIAGFKTAKAMRAELNDGLFEVVLVRRPKTLFEVRDIMTRLAMQDLNSDLFVCFKSAWVNFLADEEIQWTLDGEFGGAVSSAKITVNKEALSLIV